MLPTIWGINSYTIAAALGFASFILVFILTLDFRLKINRRELSNIIIIMVAAMGIGLGLAFFLDALFKIPDRLKPSFIYPYNSAFRFEGITWYGMLIGGFGGLALLYWLLNVIFIKKKGQPLFETNRKDYLNAAAPAMALAHFWGRLGCFAVGCCFGRPSNFLGIYPLVGSPPYRFFWSMYRNGYIVQFPVRLFPVQLVEAGILLAIFFCLFFIKNKKVRNNAVYIYLGVYAIARFILEFFRGDFRGGLFAFMGLSPGQFVSICLMIFVIYRIVRENIFLKKSKKEITNLNCCDNYTEKTSNEEMSLD